MQKTKALIWLFPETIRRAEYKSWQIFVFWGYMPGKYQGEPLKSDHVLAFCQASFLMTLSQAEFLTLAPSKLPFFSLLFTFHVKILVVMSESSNLLKSKLARMSCAGLFHYVPHFGKPHLVWYKISKLGERFGPVPYLYKLQFPLTGS